MPATDVVGQARADREHDVRGLVHLPAQRREVAAGDPEPERMVVEETARRQRVGEQGAAAIGELDHRIPRAGPQHAAASRSTASATTSGSGCMRPTLGWYIAEVS